VVRECAQGHPDGLAGSPVPCPGQSEEVTQFAGLSLVGSAGTSCDASQFSDAQWRDCGEGGDDPPIGQPAKNWPIAVVANQALHVDYVAFQLPASPTISSAMVQGHVTIGNQSFDLSQTTAAVTNANGYQILTARDLTGGSFPAAVGQDSLQVQWQLKLTVAGGNPGSFVDAGTTSQPVFVLLHRAILPSGILPQDAANDTPYLTPIALSAAAGSGMTSDSALEAAIWSQFTGRAIGRDDFDPITGEIATYVEPLKYYPSWSFSQFATQGYGPDRGGTTCPGSLLSLLYTGIGRCGHFADLMAEMLALNGLPAKVVSLSMIEGWNSILAKAPLGTEYMLVTPRQWSFSASMLPVRPRVIFSNFLNVPPYTPSKLGPFAPAQSVTGSGPVGQNNPSPPGIFTAGDHALVIAGGAGSEVIYDPSYGAGPFTSVQGWASQSLAGWARVLAGCRPGVSTCIVLARPYKP